jgi:tetratricopeptide (TPR) repeat protein
MKKTGTAKYFLAASAAVATVLVYLPSLQNDFILWDDDLYVYENPFIRSFGSDFFRWAFSDFRAGNWHPLTWMSHALDYAIWGLNPLGHHLTNIILHALNTLVVVLLVVKLLEAAVHASRPSGKSGTLPNDLMKRPDFPISFLNDRTTLTAAGMTGLLFGLHPLHVESVAWVSERKDLLCALFFMLSITTYIRYAGRGVPLWTPGMTEPGRQFLNKYYLAAFGLFVLSLLSKPMAITLPVVLLILDWYPLGRIQSFKTVRAAVVEKAPFIVLSLVSSVLTVIAQRAGESIRSIEFAPFSTRILVAAKSLAAYIWKMILPLNLSPFYPYPGETSLLSIQYLSSIALVSGVTIACVVVSKRQKLWLAVWGYYVITLIPVLGIIQVGLQSMADRYTYLPSLGPFLLTGLLAAWAWARITEKWGRHATYLAVTAFVAVIISLSYLTFRQTGIWRDSIVFWSYVIEKGAERSPLAYYNRAIAFEKTGRIDEAIADYDKAIALYPSYHEAYNNRAIVFKKIGLFDKAIADFDKAIALKPDQYMVYNNRALVFERVGLYDRAITDFDRVIALNPSFAAAYNNLGRVFRKAGQLDRAIDYYNRAISLNEAYAEAYYNRAVAYEKMGQRGRAIEDYNRAISFNPSYYEAYNNLGVLYGNASLFDKAIEYFTQAILLNQSRSGPYVNRGALYARTGKGQLAVADFQRACDLGDKAGCSTLDGYMRGQASPAH